MRFIVSLVMALSVALGGTAGCATTPAEPEPVGVSADGALTSGQLAEALPPELTFTDSLGIWQVADLPQPLAITDMQRVTDYSSGDLLYWPSEQRLVVAMFDGGAMPDDGLVLLGHITIGFDYLNSCARMCAVHLSTGR